MTLIIKNVEILGADRDFNNPIDIFVNGDKISAIGNFPKKKADVVVDGQGAYLSPGFIDVNTESDHYFGIIEYPEQTGFLANGVTSILGGMHGVSLAPLLYGDMESIEKWTHTKGFNVNWHSLKGFLEVLDKKSLGVNFTTLIGYSTIRDAITGPGLRRLTENELNVLKKVVGDAIRDGGAGLSINRSAERLLKISTNEIKNSLQFVKKSNGVYMPRLDAFDSSNFLRGFEESQNLAKEFGIKTIIDFSLPLNVHDIGIETTKSKLNSLSFAKDTYFVISPESDIYDLASFLPDWLSGESYETPRKLSDEWLGSKIMKDLPRINADQFRVVQAPGNEFLLNKSLADIQGMYDLNDSSKALFALMRTTKLKAMISYPYRDANFLQELLNLPEALIASREASLPLYKNRSVSSSAGVFMKYLALTQDKKIMSLNDAILKITRKPAEIFGFTKRGIIKEGFLADLVGFKNFEVSFTVVNGRLAWQNGQKHRVSSGRVIGRNNNLSSGNFLRTKT